YAVDGSHTSAVFSISHLGYSYTYGMFRKASGAFQFDKDNPAASRFQFTLDVSSLDTMDAKRDEHLQGADFFNARQFPQITFTSTSVTPAGEQDGKPVFDVAGTLTMHGVSKSVTLPLQYLGEGPGPYGNYRVGFLCQTTLNRSDFGMNFMVGPIGDQVGVTISFEGIQQ
ncbi:MAG: YceI family protein, partial [Planctomycetota bacterium]